MTGSIESNRLFVTKLKLNFSIASPKEGAKLDNIKFRGTMVKIRLIANER
jgi:hypothetical protein